MPYLDEIEAAIPGLRAFAQALARDRELADDLVQDTLEAALKKAGTPYRLEWYPGAQHGFAFPLREGIYDKPSAERHWIGQTLLFRGITHAPVETLQPTVTTDYSRRTIQICPADAPVSRLTIDVGLTCSTPDDNAESVSFDEYTIVETKGSPRPSRADRQLWTMGHRPLRVSKFGIGVALLNPELPDYKWHRIIKHEFAA